MAVHLAIRPRLQLRHTSPPKRRSSQRLPPLALPAAAYWVAMAGLTYVFANWEAHFPGEPPKAELSLAPPVVPPVHAAENPMTTSANEAPAARPSPAVEAAEPALLDHTSASPAETRAAVSPVVRPAAAPPAALAPVAPRSATRRQPAVSQPRRSSSLSRESLLFEAFEPAPAPEPRPDALRPSVAPADDPPSEASSTGTCEAAIARASEELNIGASRGAPDVTRDAYAAILENGRYLSSCSIPDRSSLEICAAVQGGRAVGVTVVARPADARLSACVRRAVVRLSFPQNPRLDVTRTRFDPLSP